MGDHFVLLVDRFLTESTLEAAIQSRKQVQNGHASASEVETENKLSLQKRDFGDGLRKMECRITEDRGRRREKCTSRGGNCKITVVETEQIKHMTWEKERIYEDMKKEEDLLSIAKSSFDYKKQDFLSFLAGFHRT